MAVREIIQMGNPLLREVSAPVSQFDGRLTDLIADMHDTLVHFRATTGYGRGIAAPQVGELLRLVCLNIGGERMTLINPEFTRQSPETFLVWDACFSYFGFFFQVERSYRVKVRYQDDQGQPHLLEAEGDLAELLQHELEHLDGELAIDKAIPKTFCMRQEFEKKRP